MSWGLAERSAALADAESSPVDVLVIGGGITGAGVLRDAATRGLRALLVERADFASGTSSRSSKLVHGGLRYLAEGQFGTTREACRERDLLMRLHPHLVRPVPFLLPAHRGGKVPLWQVRAALLAYRALSGFRRSARFQMVGPEAALTFCPALRRDGLQGGGVYRDGQVDDARLVLETLKSARALGAEAVSHAEVEGFERDASGRLVAAQLVDRLAGTRLRVRFAVAVNAAGPGIERVRGLDRRSAAASMRPAKGVHLVLPRERVPARGVVTFEAPNGRHLFLIPWEDVTLLGTTDEFTDEIDEPVVTIDEVHHLLGAVNHALPGLALTTNDIRSVFAGVRPLVADAADDTPSSSVKRDHEVRSDPSGLVSVAGGKLTTYRAMGEIVMDRVVAALPAERQAVAGPSRTRWLALRDEGFDLAEECSALVSRHGIAAHRAEHLLRSYGADAHRLLDEARPDERGPIGSSRHTLAEVAWSVRNECPADLCDLLERRVRLAIFAIGQGITDLEAIATAAARAAGWDETRVQAERAGYVEAVRRRYQIAPPGLASARRPGRRAA